jgi:hypothetical protein
LTEARKGDFVELGTGNTNQPIELLVWGDSHAMAVMPVLDAACRGARRSRRGGGAASDSPFGRLYRPFFQRPKERNRCFQ